MYYAANIVIYVKFDDGNQDQYPVWENITLIEADTDGEAFDKAEAIGKESDGDDFIWENRPAVWQYVGIRKLLEVHIDDSKKGFARDGIEITYSQILLKDLEI